jgi:hypothetical protein
MKLKDYITEYVSSGRGKLPPDAIINRITLDMTIEELRDSLRKLMSVSQNINFFTKSELGGYSGMSARLVSVSRKSASVCWCESNVKKGDGVYIAFPDNYLYVVFSIDKDGKITNITKFKGFSGFVGFVD